MSETPTPSVEALNGLGQVFSDYMRPAGAIHRELKSGRYTLQMVWNGFQAFADVTPVVEEAINTGKISAHGMFTETLDELLLDFARKFIERDAKTERREAKQAMRQAKILRLIEK